jgi:biotin synthase
MRNLIEKLEQTHHLEEQELLALLQAHTPENQSLLAQKALRLRRQIYGDGVCIRGLIEFTNYCKNNCYYCGIRCSNSRVQRYRLRPEEILAACHRGYELGLRSFVLQGGEDPGFPPEALGTLIRQIKAQYPDCAVTLSVGEYPKEIYAHWKEAGADRYLLRHETADPCHYRVLHPENQTLSNRLRCLQDLKDLGYQVGCGFMVGSPGQKDRQLVQDLLFIQQFRPHMVGVGPFIPQKDTPFGHYPGGSVEKTLYLLSIIRLLLPQVLLPATTALGTLHPQGRELGLLAGANVCMPNLSPGSVRKNYALYDNKLSDGAEAAESLNVLFQRLKTVSCVPDLSRGDHFSFARK